MVEDNLVKLDDVNYAVYKIGDWKNEYEINQIGLSKEIPVSGPTLTHVKLSMDEIRKSEFEIGDVKVNGFVAIALQLNSKVQKMNLDDVIALEEEEFSKILEELDDLELLDPSDTIPIDSEDYLIYKLEKDCHVTNSIPANDFTRKFYLEEMRRIEDAVR